MVVLKVNLASFSLVLARDGHQLVHVAGVPSRGRVCHHSPPTIRSDENKDPLFSVRDRKRGGKNSRI